MGGFFFHDWVTVPVRRLFKVTKYVVTTPFMYLFILYEMPDTANVIQLQTFCLQLH